MKKIEIQLEPMKNIYAAWIFGSLGTKVRLDNR